MVEIFHCCFSCATGHCYDPDCRHNQYDGLERGHLPEPKDLFHQNCHCYFVEEADK